MSEMQSEVYEAFRAIDVPEDKALKAAAALATAFAQSAAETDAAFDDRDGKIGRIESDIASIRVDLMSLRDNAATKVDLNTVKIDLAVVKGDVALVKGMVGFLLAFDVAFAFKFFFH